ncbi:SDR family NAD(P)-dependent oxidoreductase [Nocardia farcinica]|uniref:3-oxoacyl-[acyl-carrier-protein] reductase MabA n=1 Tax=Nocardia farcinica (strain IFM 10152) TaxID=247156 RepID=Q5YUB5_NOCFA|nr:SDR family NAD(P)-dependent oxidoreductase [Nocardia farcinica]MBF6387733.1 SDR family oxidoreductase [Nocardia farcinica]BAD58226.1 putative short chain dehydrogenase [Nocardia farcinica IFM 10152]
MFELDGRIALVTGAGQSVGEGIATVLARQGATVVVNDLFADRAQRVAEAILAEGNKAIARAFDVTDYQATVAAVRSAEAELGHHVDILVNNAGVAEDRVSKPFRELTPEQWPPSIDLNIYGALNCIKAVIDGMCDNGWGRVVQISSGSARTGQNINVSMYATGKSGIEGFIRHLAAETGQYGVTANIVALGLQANLVHKMPPEQIERLIAGIPIGRLGDPIEVGAFCAYLASNEAGGMTGQTLDFNGGSQTR